MATEATPKFPQADDVGRSGGVSRDHDVVDLTELELHPAPEAERIAGLLQAEVSPSREGTGPRVPPPGPIGAVRFLVLLVAGLFAPLAVLYGAVALPVATAVQGALVAAGWVGLGMFARRYETRRRRR